MALTPSTMQPLGIEAPAFSLPCTVTGRIVTRDAARGPRGLLVAFLCNHCPYVKHIRAQLALLGRWCNDQGVGMVGISSNDAASYPADSPLKMADEARDAGYTFPYLYDESQAVARAYNASCTPDFFLFDANLRLAYRGQLDDARPGNGVPVTGADLRSAIERISKGQSPHDVQKPSIGCNIKWKPGNAPV